MARRMDPPHDRVVLSGAERRMLASLERLLDEPEPPAVGSSTAWTPSGPPASRGARLRRSAPWLVPWGAVLLAAALLPVFAAAVLASVVALVEVAVSTVRRRRGQRRWRTSRRRPFGNSC